MNRELAERLVRERTLSLGEYERLLDEADDCDAAALAAAADAVRRDVFGAGVFVRGLVEISNRCKNDCLYCGIRRGNASARRYRLAPEEIVACADEGYRLGFMTVVLQGGEDPFFTDDVVCGIVRAVKRRHPDQAVTLSLGERSFESYRALREAGADRYLLRHETASPEHYAKLHPPEMRWDARMERLRELRRLGFQVGCGFMVGSPFQTSRELAMDLKFVEEFRPEMCGVGPFVPHRDTPLGRFPAGSAEKTCLLLSILRLIHPPMLIPATTALGTVAEDGRERGILAGANVVMPNLSPTSVRSKYELYDNKVHSAAESAQCLEDLSRRLEAIGFHVAVGRGDFRAARTIPGERMA